MTLAEARRRAGLTQRGLARASGVAAATIAAVETDRGRGGEATRRRLAAALGLAAAAIAWPQAPASAGPRRRRDWPPAAAGAAAEELLTTGAAAARLGCHYDTVMRWIGRGDLPARRVGRAIWAVARADVEAFAAGPRANRGGAPAPDAADADP